MKRRLYFLLPDVSSTRQVVNELLLARIDSRRIHVIAKDETSVEGLPEANLFQKSDLIHGLEMGLVIGGLTGALGGIIASQMNTLLAGGALILACSLAGAFVGAWVAGMIGTDVRNSQIKNYQQAIDNGEILLMVDTPKNRVTEIISMIKRRHPEAHGQRVEPTIPAFP